MRASEGCIAKVLLLVSVLAASPSAYAGPTAKDRAAAKALVAKGRSAARQKRYGDAAAALQRADELAPSAQTKLDLARALAPQGKLREAIKVLSEAVDGASLKEKKVAAAATKLIGELETKVPTLTVKASGPAPSKVLLSVDGEHVQPGKPIEVDPGEHVVTADAEGYSPGEKSVTVAEGEKKKFTITLTRLGADPATDAGDQTGADEGGRASGGSIVPAAIAFGIGAVGIGVGAVFGVMAFDETSEVEPQCTGGRCPPASANALETAKTNGTVSTIGFVVGGVGVASGLVLLLTRGSGGRDKQPPSESAFVRPYLGVGHAGVHGRF